MKAPDKQALYELAEQLERLLRGDFSPIRLSVPPGPEVSRLAELIAKLTASLREAQDFITTLSKGGWTWPPLPATT